MDALAGVDVLDFNNPAAPTADSVDGVYAEPAVADEPRHHYLSHWLYPLFSSLAKEAVRRTVAFLHQSDSHISSTQRACCDQLVTAPL
jgi:hypothetical protein